jgi:hypothetical protein
MKRNPSNLMAACSAVLVLTAMACNNNRDNSTDRNADMVKDTSLTDTRRNSGDTVNYLTKDSGNQSQEVVDPNPPQNSR